jgi:hypothetical protein
MEKTYLFQRYMATARSRLHAECLLPYLQCLHRPLMTFLTLNLGQKVWTLQRRLAEEYTDPSKVASFIQ